jgi:hypothetical protein
MTTRRVATCCGAGLPSGNAVVNRKQGLRVAGMRPSTRAEGSLRSSGAPAGLLLARAVDGSRRSGLRVNQRLVKEAEA